MINRIFVGRCPPLTEFTDYSYWISANPLDVINAAVMHGGWSSVFPTEVPGWASSVRNYFNDVPTTLTPLDDRQRREAMRRLPHLRFDDESYWQRFKRARALVGPVFKSVSANHKSGSRFWYLMHPLGAHYHTGDATPPGWWDKLVKGILERDDKHVVFKLVSPDEAGGSSEIIVNNWKRLLGKAHPEGHDRLGGKPGKPFSIFGKLDVNMVTRGSYNYSESITQGIGPHELRDVKPHNRYGPNHYTSPPMLLPMRERWFPRELAREIAYDPPSVEELKAIHRS